jgi:hypothetical protein
MASLANEILGKSFLFMGEDLGEEVEENPTSTNVYTSVHNLHSV